MKFRESGMPEAQVWNSFFNSYEVLDALEVNKSISTLMDIGCGYGTFVIPASKMITGSVIGIDIDETVLENVRNEINRERIKNIDIIHEDVTNIKAQEVLMKYKGQIDYICLFYMLHCEDPESLLMVTSDLLKPNGKLGVIHWIDDDTPRGPSRDIRPKPEQIKQWCHFSNYHLRKEIDLPPYHFGQVYEKIDTFKG